MKKVKQLSLFLDNKPGVLSRICAVLQKRKVNLIGISITDGHDYAIVRMVVDNAKVALHCLGSAGLLVVENDVILIDLNNKIGSLGRVARILAQKKLNIEYSYCTADLKEGSAKLVLSVNDTARALKVLKRIKQ